MWQCAKCNYSNVDAAPVCNKCRAVKPVSDEDLAASTGGNKYQMQMVAARDKAAVEVLEKSFSPNPPLEDLVSYWGKCTDNPANIHLDLARIEKQQYALRDSIRLLVSVLKNPRALGNPELIDDALRMLKNWDRD
ncbi:hypothetical protein KDL29_15890 [bacterium]|nr:hypothetical protein [bacterium]UNM07228.1 MAG: hypothetical protein H7A35_10120 [Planctomycetales bacterium]